MKWTSEGLTLSWDEVKEVLFCANQGVLYTYDGYKTEKRKEVSRCVAPSATDAANGRCLSMTGTHAKFATVGSTFHE